MSTKLLVGMGKPTHTHTYIHIKIGTHVEIRSRNPKEQSRPRFYNAYINRSMENMMDLGNHKINTTLKDLQRDDSHQV